MRTARGAGRFDLFDERLDDEDFRRVWLPDDRVVEVLLRDAGGEDVRVAMGKRLCDRHSSLMRHTPKSAPGSCGAA